MAAGERKKKHRTVFSLTSGVVGNFFQLHKDLGPTPPFFGADAAELLELGVFG
jgi:hypothetical protein